MQVQYWGFHLWKQQLAVEFLRIFILNWRSTKQLFPLLVNSFFLLFDLSFVGRKISFCGSKILRGKRKLFLSKLCYVNYLRYLLFATFSVSSCIALHLLFLCGYLFSLCLHNFWSLQFSEHHNWLPNFVEFGRKIRAFWLQNEASQYLGIRALPLLTLATSTYPAKQRIFPPNFALHQLSISERICVFYYLLRQFRASLATKNCDSFKCFRGTEGKKQN